MLPRDDSSSCSTHRYPRLDERLREDAALFPDAWINATVPGFSFLSSLEWFTMELKQEP